MTDPPNRARAQADRPEPEEALPETPRNPEGHGDSRDVTPVEPTPPEQRDPPIDDDDRDPARRADAIAPDGA